MSTIYEVRRGKAVVTVETDAAMALAFAKVHSHAPDLELKVYAVERREWLITEPPEIVPIGATGLRAGRGRS